MLYAPVATQRFLVGARVEKANVLLFLLLDFGQVDIELVRFGVVGVHAIAGQST